MLKSTLDQLQLLPIREERWLWLMSAHPTALSLLAGLIGLPVYTVAVLTGRWSWLDLPGLLMLFLLLGHVAPAWQPLLWKQQIARASGQKIDWKAWQAALKQSKTDANPAEMTPAGRLEMQRRQQRAVLGLDAGLDAVPVVDPTTMGERPGLVAPSDSRAASGDQRKAARSGTSNSFLPIWSRWIVWWMGFQFAVPMLTGLWRGTLGPLSLLWSDLIRALPYEVRSLFPAFPLTWPLIVARGIFAPLPFFSFTLPFVVPFVPLYIGFRQQRYAALAATVSASETFWTPRRVRQRHNLGAALWIGVAFVFFGYGWNSFIVKGALSSLLQGAPPTTVWALAAAWTLTVATGALVAGINAEKTFARTSHEAISTPDAWRIASRAVVLSLAASIVLYFIFCWLGQSSGVSTAWLARLLPTLATCAAFVSAHFALAALLPILPEDLRFPLRVVRFLWFYGLVLDAMGHFLIGIYTRHPFSLAEAPYIMLSPYVSLLALFRFDLGDPQAIWWWGPLFQALVAAPCLLVAAARTFGVAAATAAAPGEIEAVQPGLMDRCRALLLAPFTLLRRTLLLIIESLTGFFGALNRIVRGWNAWAIEWSRHFGNPVLTAELQRRMNREYWPLQWLLLLLGGAGLFWVAAEPWNLAALAANGGATSIISWCHSIMLSLLIAAVGFGCLSVVSLGQAFDRERTNGNLVFLFLTPMTDRSIILGKLLPGLLHSALLLTTTPPFLLIPGVLYALAGADIVLGLAVLGWGVAATLTTILFVACLQTVFSIRAVKPMEGSQKALLCLFVHIATLIALMVWLSIVQESGGVYGLPLYIWVLLATPVLHSALAYLCWRLALHSMRRRRYGDVAVTSR